MLLFIDILLLYSDAIACLSTMIIVVHAHCVPTIVQLAHQQQFVYCATAQPIEQRIQLPTYANVMLVTSTMERTNNVCPALIHAKLVVSVLQIAHYAIMYSEH
eukprot:GHVR01136454.1.p2 GENE.GHVR01136454.1~~GHVR01136454.1.p2  ORF type:complete len:103 (+),score=6.44 GHVR01136454.1:2019-2327(+)